MNIYKCTDCGTEFDDRSSYCEDWRQPDKKLGCPSCKIFFKITAEKTDWTSSLSLSIWTVSVLGLVQSINNQEFVSSTALGIILLLSGILSFKVMGRKNKFVSIERVSNSQQAL